jgi:hypothetical protein
MTMDPISVTTTVVLRRLAFAIYLTQEVTINFTAMITKEISLGHDFCQSWEYGHLNSTTIDKNTKTLDAARRLAWTGRYSEQKFERTWTSTAHRK